jgi:subtilisin family serine protease
MVVVGIYAQPGVYKNGVRQGVVNVKFESGMDNTLKSAKISTKSNKLSTGIANFDRVASNIKATNMRRMFPDTPQNAHKLRKHGLHLWYVIDIDESVDPKQAAQSLKNLGEISIADYDREKVLPPHNAVKYTPTTVKALTSQPFNDPLLKDQWHYKNEGQRGLPDVYDVNMFEAWKLAKGRSDIIVAVHDAGIDVNHEDLKDNMWVNLNETASNGLDDDYNGYEDDIHGWNFVYNMPTMVASDHGTHVAGTIAAMNDNGIGVSGIAGGTGKGDGVKIMALQIVGADAAGIAASYVYAAEHGAVISQNSWSYRYADYFEEAVHDAIKYFIAEAGDYDGSPMKGGIVIFASGNESSEGNWYPCNQEYVFTVNSLGPDGKLAKYSNFGTWTNICAPGGNSAAVNNGFGPAAGVLSTFAGNEYGYMDGTSMACPHVSGIAALVLANSSGQMTNDMLWKRLSSAGRNIDDLNPGFVGKMGSGAIDALIAVQNDHKIAPNKVTDLVVKTFSETSVTLEWTIPSDEDNIKPEYYTVYYSRDILTNSNYKNALSLKIENTDEPGEKMTTVIDGLVGNTTYYFALTSTDLWENVSDLSNIISGKSDVYASIGVNTGNPVNDISLSANVTTSKTSKTAFDILNKSTGTLQWQYYMRNTGSVMATSSAIVSHNPVVDFESAQYTYNVGGEKNTYGIVRSERNAVQSKMTPFTPIEKAYAVPFVGTYIGDNDASIPVSSAVKYIVDEEEGFNLTGVQFNLSYTAGTGDIRVEVYRDDLDKKNLFYTESFNSPGNLYRELVSVDLKEQLYFEKGSTFYIAIHVPKGNLYPMLIGKELSSEYSAYCYYSSSQGNEWVLLEKAVYAIYGPEAPNYAWYVAAMSKLPDTGQYLTLNPASGNIEGNSSSNVELTADATFLINGTYNTNLILTSNSPENEELRVPVTFTVSGHTPEIVYPTLARFGEIFVENDTIVDIVFENHGYGLIKDLTAIIIGSSDFKIQTSPDNIQARNIVSYRIKYAPSSEGAASGTLIVSDGTSSFSVSLYGLGKGVAKFDLSPLTQTIDDITIGDDVVATMTVTNNGTYPLEYFIPGYDNRGISNNWPDAYHSYGYIVRSNHADMTDDTSLLYEFTDISSTGVDITSSFNGENMYATVPIGFKFPYYNGTQETIYVTEGGFTTFDTSINPMNTPGLGSNYSPAGYISLLGYSVNGVNYKQGKILYKSEPDRLIIQYENGTSTPATNPESFTAQMVLFANGDIRFYYKDVPPANAWGGEHILILIEDMDKKDGIELRDYTDQFFITDGTAIGFDYPGASGVINAIENASGSVSPNEAKSVQVKMSTASLAEGQTDRYITFITNDPKNKNVHGHIKLDVVAGGVEDHTISTNDLDFGNVYKDIYYSNIIKIINTGTKDISISSIDCDPYKYTVTGHMTIKPGQFSELVVVPNTTAEAQLEDILTINFASGTQEIVNLKANVSLAPAIKVDDSLVEQSMSITDKVSVPFTIENEGDDNLQYSVLGTPALRFKAIPSATPDEYGYDWIRHNNGEPAYNWIDISETGTHITDMNTGVGCIWSEDITLPFSFQFYGENFSALKVSNWGIIAFDGNPDILNLRNARLPMANTNSAYIAPGLGALLYNNAHYEGFAGVYYEAFNDKFVITWECIMNTTGMGTISEQLILYKDGSFKCQYKIKSTFDGTSNTIMVGMQEKGKKTATIIHQRVYFDHGKGLVYYFTPNDKHTLSPGETVSGNIEIDPSKIYGGVIMDTLRITSNDPVKPLIKKPFKLSIAGSPVLDIAQTEVDFGFREVTIDIETGSEMSYKIPLNITNTGITPLTITDARMEKGDQSLGYEMYLYNSVKNDWITVDDYFASASELIVLPGKGNQIQAQAAFTPLTHGEYEDVLILTTDAGEKRITIKGQVKKVESPVFNISTAPIEFSFNSLDETKTETVTFDNIQGDADLNYSASVKYTRYASDTHLNSVDEGEKIGSSAPDSLQFYVKDITSSKKTTKDGEEFNRTLMYNEDAEINSVLGLGGQQRFAAATHFNAGPDGFNASHVATWFRAEDVASGVIEAEVRAGGHSIYDAVTVARGTLEFSNPTKDDYNGSLQIIKLDNEALILPNEDLYVIFRYPLLIQGPQGGMRDTSVERVPYRYMFRANNAWYDAQDPDYGFIDFEDGAYAHMVLESEAKSSGWLRILNNQSGVVKVGESSSLDIETSGEFAVQGEQKAVLYFVSDDIQKPTVEVPVILNMNKGPQFNNAPVSITIAETETRSYSINVEDPENHTITSIEPVANVDFVTYSVANDILTINLAPQYGDEGSHSIVFRATDEHEMSNDLTLNIQVTKTNRPPAYIRASDELVYGANAGETIYNIADFFADPDGDSFTYTVVSENPAVVSVDPSTTTFRVNPLSVGNTKLLFTVTDANGMSADVAVKVKVTAINKAPEFVGTVTGFTYSVQGDEMEYKIEDFFADPDNHNFTLAVKAEDPAIVSVYISAGAFRVKPEAIGKTKLLFTMTDEYGAVGTHSLNVTIDDCISTDVIVQKWNSVLLVNNSQGNYKPDGYQWYKDGQPISGATKQYYAAGGNGSEDLDFNALYFVKMVTTSGKVVYSCNYQPERRDISLKAYPNPVKLGQELVLEAKLPDLDTNPIEIQIIGLSGTVVKKQTSKQTITSLEMPAQSGSYLIRVSSGMLTRTFNIIVE